MPPEAPFDDLSSHAQRLIARIYAAGCGATDEEPSAIADSDDFRSFLEETGPVTRCVPALFDVRYYLQQLPKPLRSRVNPVVHYVTAGASLGLSPHRLFAMDEWSIEFRAQQAADLHDRDETPDAHGVWATAPTPADFFVATLEVRRPPFVTPHPLFEPEIWVAGADEVGLAPVLEFAATTDIGDRPFSRYFSIPFYESTRPGLRSGRSNHLLHYLEQAANRVDDEPNPLFDAPYYRREFDVDSSDLLSYYILVGASRGHLPNPFALHELGLHDEDLLSAQASEMLLEYIQVPIVARQKSS